MNALLAQFIPEARELLEQAGSGLLVLEQDAKSKAAVNDVFRAVHTLKGSSGLFDLQPLTRLVHAAEDLLGEVRTGELALNAEIVDRLLDSLDLVAVWIDALETREALPGDAEANMTQRVAVMRQWLSNGQAGLSKREPASVSAILHGASAPGWLAHLPEPDRIGAWAQACARPLLAWSFEPEEDCFFRGDDPVELVRGAPGVVAVRVVWRGAAQAFPDLDPLACLLRFEVLSDATRESLEEHMRYVVERVEMCAVSADDLILPVGEPLNGPVFADFAETAREMLASKDVDGLGRSIDAMLNLAAPASVQASALRWCKVLLARDGLQNEGAFQRLIHWVETGAALGDIGVGRPAWALAPSSAPTVSDACENAADLALAERLAREQIRVLETAADPAIVEGKLQAVAAVLRNLAIATGQDHIASVLDTAVGQWRLGDFQGLRSLAAQLGGRETQSSPQPATARHEGQDHPQLQADPTPAPTTDPKSVNRVLRVDQTKIDSIMNLVAELIVAKNGLSYLATRAEQVHGARIVAREIKEQFAVIDRITQGLQVGVMAVRMMPVGQVFQRFPRLVRDVSRKLGKTIDLVIEGEETEADKNVLESLADPLIHMLRNSLDHGIETPEERLAAGKREQGTVRIIARQESEFVVIDMIDDGRGVDPERVKDKALRLGLISAERAAQMSDEEAANLVFAPGFSTKEEVSDLSGRGVGMDVVRTAVAKAGGSVALRTTLGLGTSVTLRLPLTMAVTRIVTIDCQGRLFGIPMDAVVETVRISKNQIHRIKAAETFVLRETLIPILRLAKALNLQPPGDGRAPDEEAVLVVKVGQDQVGLVVDGFRERIEVIVKPLEGVLEGLPGFAGTALLGDGRVLLILDLREIL